MEEHLNDSTRILYTNADEYTYTKREYPTNGITYTILRWPILFFIGSILLFELLLYALVRWGVYLWEIFSGIKGRTQRNFRKDLQSAKDFRSWRKAAHKLDRYDCDR